MGFSLQLTARQLRVTYLNAAIGAGVGAVAAFVLTSQLVPAVFGLFLGACCGGGISAFLASPDREPQVTIDSVNFVYDAMFGRIYAAAVGALIGLVLGLVGVGIALLVSNNPPIAVWLTSAGTIGALIGVIVGRP